MKKLAFMLLLIPMTLTFPSSNLLAELDLGAEAVDFSYPWCDASGITGEKFTLSTDGKDKVVYLQFCNPKCGRSRFMIESVERHIYPNFSNNDDVVFTCITYAFKPYSVDDVREMILATGYSQPILAADDFEAFMSYDIASIPYIYIIDRNGTIQYSQKGPVHASEINDKISELLGIEPPVPEPTPEPKEISVSCSDSVLRGGEEVIISAEVGIISQPFDAYGVIRRPDGFYLSTTRGRSLHEGIVPLATNVPSHSSMAHYSLLQTTIPRTSMPGSYEVTVGLTAPGTLTTFCSDQCSVTIE